jgi:hypothetical protein
MSSRSSSSRCDSVLRALRARGMEETFFVSLIDRSIINRT